MPRMPLIEYEEPAESVLTEDTCVTEPVDTAQRERVVRALQEDCAPGRGSGGLKQRHSPYTGLDPSAEGAKVQG